METKTPERVSKREEPQQILVVDDEQSVTIRVGMMLRSAGFRVLTANCGEQALDLLLGAERPSSLVLFDLVMPGMDGWRFREIQKGHSALWWIPAVAMAEAPVNEEYFASLEASGLLLKPFERGEALRLLTRVLAGQRVLKKA